MFSSEHYLRLRWSLGLRARPPQGFSLGCTDRPWFQPPPGDVGPPLTVPQPGGGFLQWLVSWSHCSSLLEAQLPHDMDNQFLQHIPSVCVNSWSGFCSLVKHWWKHHAHQGHTVHVAVTLFPFTLSLPPDPLYEGLTFLLGPKLRDLLPFNDRVEKWRDQKEFYCQQECFASEEEILFHVQAINDRLCYLNYC